MDIVLLVYGQVCRSCHVHHTKVSRSQIPWPNPNYKGGWETQSPGVSGMRNGTGASRASLYPTPGDKILRAGCQVRWLVYHCSLPQIAQIQACPIHMKHWHSDTKGRADLGHEFATAGFCFFK